MNPERWREIRRIFEEAIAMPAHNRLSHIEEACSGDPELRGEVSSLLQSHDEAGSIFLKNPAVDFKSAAAAAPAPSRVGRRIGAYQIIEEIAHGGMGEVYRAVRADGEYDRQVAIKVVRVGFDTPEVLERFRRERQILATLEHSNIARLLDAGTTDDGIPYLVMELIEGTPVDRYCQKNDLSVAERLRLFRQVCLAVQYAHQRLVIHRDIKPNNILVTADGVPKLLDFGIAKIFDPEAGTDATVLRPMTPEYASPEQIRGDPITTATDVYSLGVVLYRLLTGRSPYPEKTRTALEFAKVICEIEPARPSTEAAQVSQPVAQTSKETRSPVHSMKLKRMLKGDLDNIVLKSLRKEPARRYGSVEQLAEDIRRHLDGLPVTASPDSASYRLNKFVRRHKAGAVATALIAMTVTGGVAATIREARVAAANQRRAEQRFNDVRKLANSLMFEIHDSIQDLPGATQARKLIIQRALQYLDSLSRESSGDSSLQRELAAAYARVGDIQMYRGEQEETAGGIASYQKALAIREVLHTSDPRNLNDAVALADSSILMAEALLSAGLPMDALSYSNRAVAISERLAHIGPNNAKFHEELAHDYANQANVLAGDFNWSNLGDNRAALVVRRKQLEAARRAADLEPNLPAAKRRTGDAMIMLGDQLLLNGERRSAHLHYLQAEQVMENLRGHVDSAQLLNDTDALYQRIANLELQNGDYKESEVAARKALRTSEDLTHADPENVWARLMLAEDKARLANLLCRSGRINESIRLVNQALDIISDVARLNSNNTDILGTQANIQLTAGRICKEKSENAQAIRHYQSAIAIYSRVQAVQPGNPGIRLFLAAGHNGLGMVQTQMHDVKAAKDTFQNALAFSEAGNSSISSSVEASYMRTTSYAGLGMLEMMQAKNAKGAAAQNQHWKSARKWYALSLKAWSLINEPGMTSANGFDIVPLRSVNEQMAKCNAVLKQETEEVPAPVR